LNLAGFGPHKEVEIFGGARQSVSRKGDGAEHGEFHALLREGLKQLWKARKRHVSASLREEKHRVAIRQRLFVFDDPVVFTLPGSRSEL
jgi:hypothetical protein